jgi:hypothetical protein
LFLSRLETEATPALSFVLFVFGKLPVELLVGVGSSTGLPLEGAGAGKEGGGSSYPLHIIRRKVALQQGIMLLVSSRYGIMFLWYSGNI